MKQNLNGAQIQAVLHGTGPMMVLAGPGSGKTLVITRRIENLIKHKGVNPICTNLARIEQAAVLSFYAFQ